MFVCEKKHRNTTVNRTEAEIPWIIKTKARKKKENLRGKRCWWENDRIEIHTENDPEHRKVKPFFHVYL